MIEDDTIILLKRLDKLESKIRALEGRDHIDTNPLYLPDDLYLKADDSHIYFGASGDVNLYRYAPNWLITDSNLVVRGQLCLGASDDTFLYRAGADWLRTTDTFEVYGTYGAGFLGASTTPASGRIYYQGDNSGWGLQIGKRVAAVYTPQIWIQDNGNTGIGVTPNASYKLHVGDATRAAIGFSNLYHEPHVAGTDSNGDKLIFYEAAGESYRIGLGDIADIWYQSTGIHRFLTGATGATIGVEALTLTSAGVAVLGNTAALGIRLGQRLDINTVSDYGGIAMNTWAGAAVGRSPVIDFNKSRGALNAFTIVANGDELGYIVWRGSDNTDWSDAGYIRMMVDDAPAANIVPGRMEFNTTNAAGTSNMGIVIKATGRVGLSEASPNAQLDVYQGDSTATLAVLQLHQMDIDQEFADFIGTSAAGVTRSITTQTASWTHVGGIRVAVNGTDRWIPVYSVV